MTLKIIGRLGDCCPEIHGGGIILRDEQDGSAFIEYTHGSECEEGAFAPDRPQPECGLCDGSGAVDRGTNAERDCGDCHGKGHLFAFDVYCVDIPRDVVKEYDWARWEEIAKSIDMDVVALKAAGRRFREPLLKASVIEAIGDFHGWYELDYDPIKLTEHDLEARWTAYEKEEKKA